MSGGHLSLDALADVLADPGAHEPHLTDCALCRERVDAAGSATERVSALLGALPPPALPGDVAARVDDALAVASVPEPGIARRRRGPAPMGPWLAVAAAVVVAAGTVLAVSLRPGGDGGAQSGSAAPEIARNATGNNYARDSRLLTAALPALLSGGASGAPASARGGAPAAAVAGSAADAESGTAAAEQRAGGAPDPLARLRDPVALASCLSAILPPEDPAQRPLALDYAAFEGKPALVVVLPATDPVKVDVFVVGAACSAANDHTLFFARVSRPG